MLEEKLTLDLEAKTKPESYAESAEWVVPEVDRINCYVRRTRAFIA
jgi:hypothetical protein